MSRFVAIDRDTAYLLAPSVDEWLPSDHLARYVAANTHPDHDTLATYRRRFLKEVESVFVQVLMLAREMKLLKLGHIALDGTKIEANASKHKALSWAHANKIEAQLRREVQMLLALAESRDAAASLRTDSTRSA